MVAFDFGGSNLGIIRIVINNYQMIRYAEQYLSMNTTVRLVLQMAIYGLILYQTFTLTKKRKNAIEISNTEKQKNLLTKNRSHNIIYVGEKPA